MNLTAKLLTELAERKERVALLKFKLDGFDHACWRGPRIDRHLDPSRHRRRADPAVLPDEVHDAPPTIPLLEVYKRERSHFGSPQTTAQEHGQDGAIAQSAEGRDIRRA